MNNIMIVLILVIGFLVGVPAAHAKRIHPSFDCDVVTTPVAQVICSDEVLSYVDGTGAQAYWALFYQIGEESRHALKAEYARFRDSLENRCQTASNGPMSEESSMKHCVWFAYYEQEKLWKSRLRPPASEEANRTFNLHVFLQQALKEKGLLPANATTNGVYDSATRDAIVHWQKSHGRKATGFISDADAIALQLDCGDTPTPPRNTFDTSMVQSTTGILDRLADSFLELAKINEFGLFVEIQKSLIDRNNDNPTDAIKVWQNAYLIYSFCRKISLSSGLAVENKVSMIHTFNDAMECEYCKLDRLLRGNQ